MNRVQRRIALTAAAAVVLAVGAGAALTLGGAGSADAQPASQLGGAAHMGAVELASADPEALASFYIEGVGLALLGDDAGRVSLGIGEQELLRIVPTDAAADDAREAGLYHSAFLYPDAESLAEAVLATATYAPTSFVGSSDHTVSQAFYFVDSDGNGVELYVDRPSDQWMWTEGEVVMGSFALDPNVFLAENLTDAQERPALTALTMGHVHLRGGDLERAEEFYEDTLGMAVTARSDGAIFLSADGYHHHIAVNVWNSAGAGMRPESQGLAEVTVVVPEVAELDLLAERLDAAGVDYTRSAESITTNDPWGTVIVVRL